MEKGLEEIKTLRTVNQREFDNDKNVNNSLDIIEKELKVLEIIKEYQVDIWLLLNCNYDDYIRIRKECLIENKILVDNEEKNDILPEEFFYYLNEVLL